jgi:hypothetical protein
MRLGELLLQKGVITKGQLQTALHEQGRCGGRLGTNLIELGYADVDTIALALSVQRGFPALRREHIAAIDARVLGLFPESVVTKHKAIPIGYTMTKPPRVVVASMDPTTTPIDELAFAAGSRIEAWIAPEALIQECLEKYFGAPPVQRRYVSVTLEAQGAASLGSLRLPTAVHPGLTEAAPPAPALAKSSAPAKKSKARVLSPPPPPPPAPASPVVLTLDPPPRPSIEFPPGSSVELPPEEDWDIPSEESSASSSLPPASPIPEPSEPPKPPPVTMPPPAAMPLSAPPEALRPMIDQAQASMLMEMATSKEQIGRALEDWLRSTFGCGLVLVIKGDMAIGWRGFFPDAEDLIEAVAIPLGKPSMFSAAFEAREPFRGAPPEGGAKIQDRLWKLLRCAAPSEALVCPVVLGKRAVNLLYAHMDDGTALTDEAVGEANALALEAAAAYARLIGRDRKKK